MHGTLDNGLKIQVTLFAASLIQNYTTKFDGLCFSHEANWIPHSLKMEIDLQRSLSYDVPLNLSISSLLWREKLLAQRFKENTYLELSPA